MNKLITIQTTLKAPKNQRNNFGNYNFRNCEDILEALKPLLSANNCLLLLKDEIIEVGGRIYVKATASLFDGEKEYSTTAMAREEETQKGMNVAQITGSASSYARKYALNALFLIDDTKDADSVNTHGKQKDTPEIAIWDTQVRACQTIETLEALWNDNKDSIGGDKSIINLFKIRKKLLNGK